MPSSRYLITFQMCLYQCKDNNTSQFHCYYNAFSPC